VQLTFSNGTNCLNPSISNPGDYFIRSGSFTLNGPRGSLETTTAAHVSYQGESIGGGAKVTRQADGSLGVDVLGGTKILKVSSGDEIMDISIRTKKTVTMNQLRRAGRVITGGELEIIHNLARFNAVHTYSGLTWGEAGCCYPTSGTIDIAFSGNLDGTAQVVFNGCGSFTVTRGADSAVFSLANCE